MSTANPFALATNRSSNTALADASRDKKVAEVQSQMGIAKRFPRDPIAAVDRILNACTRPTLAESALYSYSRGGSDVTGPSIRLAEALAQSWGNIDCGVREVEQANGVSTMESYATDLESNYRVSKIFTVPHFRYTKAGTKKLEDPRDIYELTANQGARRLRACILSVIPGDVVEAAVKQCETTLHASADITPDAIKKMLAVFAQFGVTPQQIEARIQRRIDAIQPAQVVSLKKIYASLRDGMSSPGDWFGSAAAEGAPAEAASGATSAGPRSSTQNLKAQLKGRGKGAEAPMETPAAQDPAPPLDLTPPSEGEALLDSLRRSLASAKTQEDIDECLDFARSLPLTEAHQQELNQWVDEAMRRIG